MDVWQGSAKDIEAGLPADVVLLHGPRGQLVEAAATVRARSGDALLVGCSGAGEIFGTSVVDSCIATTVRFNHASARLASVHIEPGQSSADVGARLASELPTDGLRHVLVYADGLMVNGTALVEGLSANLPDSVAITGGLAGDDERFEETVVVAGDEAGSGIVAAVGLYGPIHIGYGSLGGWDPFGPRREVTRSKGNVVYEFDGRPALDLYKQYLGEHAAGLPATGLLFPLFLPEVGDGLVRTILAVDEEARSLTYAGDVPSGAIAQFMKANFDRIVDGAHGAALATRSQGGTSQLALLVSCVGRRLVLKQRVEDELDAVQEVLGTQAVLAGYYSYGEICPAAPGANCQLHNQTMTITTLRED